MRDPDDFVGTHARANGIETEKEAAVKAAETAEAHKALILQVLEDAGEDGLINEQVADKVGSLLGYELPERRARRLYDLRLEGKVRHHPHGRTAPNEGGSGCIAWVLGREPNLEEIRRKAVKPKPKSPAALRKALQEIDSILTNKWFKGEDLKAGSPEFLQCMKLTKTHHDDQTRHSATDE